MPAHSQSTRRLGFRALGFWILQLFSQQIRISLCSGQDSAAFCVGVGGFQVSEAEDLGLKCPEGATQRPERC